MAQVTGTTDSYRTGTAGGNREDLEDVIWQLNPDETWCMTNFDHVDANAAYHEWLIDKLAAPAANAQIEGDDVAYVTITQPTRVGNYQQISRKTFLVSRTQEKVAKAGRKRESARQLVKQMRELKNDMEYTYVRNQGASVGGSGTARATAGMESWIEKQTKATTTASAATTGFTAGGAPTPTDGTTTGPLVIASLQAALQDQWSLGGSGKYILTGIAQKTAIDGFTSIATRFVDIDRTQQAVIHNAANVFVSDFGTHTVLLHRHVRASVVMCIDPEFWAVSFIDTPFKEELAKTGDGRKFAITAEWGVVCRNNKANTKVVACT